MRRFFLKLLESRIFILVTTANVVINTFLLILVRFDMPERNELIYKINFWSLFVVFAEVIIRFMTLGWTLFVRKCFRFLSFLMLFTVAILLILGLFTDVRPHPEFICTIFLFRCFFVLY